MHAAKTAVIVLGAAGKMGAKVTESVKRSSCCVLAGAFDVSPGPGLRPPEDLASALRTADVAIDFTSPRSAVEYARACAGSRKPIVVGTTGFDKAELSVLKRISRIIPVFLSPNMSPAVNLTFAVAKLLASKLGEGFDIHISETHHKLKKDAPSGTALKYLAYVKEAHKGPVPVTSVRAGDIVGEHTVLYAGPHERVELTHRAHSRDVFAHGAVKAALWLAGKKPGLYDFSDLLGLKELL